MLVLTRKSNQSIMIGDDIEVSVLAIMGEKVRIGIQADRTVPRARNESTLISARAQTFEGCGQELRVTIAAALAGPQPGRD